MSEYTGRPAFGTLYCQRCGATVQGMFWLSFVANGEPVGDICENCRCALMADYIIPCGYRAHGDDWHYTGTVGRRRTNEGD